MKKLLILLTYVYFIVEDFKALDEILQLGQRYNIKQSIYNLALIDIKNKRYDRALKYLQELPEDYKGKEVLELKGAVYMQKALTYFEDRKYEKALPYFLNARKTGIKNLESYISKIYLEINDKENAEKYLNISAKNGNIESIKNLAFFYSENNNSQKAIKYFEILYYKGYVEYVLNIYLEYYKLSNMQETIKWYKIGRSVGIIDRNEKIERLIKYYN